MSESSPPSPLILKRAPFDPNREDYKVLEGGIVVGRIFKVLVALPDRPWMWASGHNGEIRRAAHGYEPARSFSPPATRLVRTGATAPLRSAPAISNCAFGP
jgi:hypothetical protein